MKIYFFPQPVNRLYSTESQEGQNSFLLPLLLLLWFICVWETASGALPPPPSLECGSGFSPRIVMVLTTKVPPRFSTTSLPWKTNKNSQSSVTEHTVSIQTNFQFSYFFFEYAPWFCILVTCNYYGRQQFLTVRWGSSLQGLRANIWPPPPHARKVTKIQFLIQIVILLNYQTW